MSAREWELGDVAMVVNVAGEEKVARFSTNLVGGPRWIFADGSSLSVREVTCARPLVVIDPEDREQVERLLGRFYGLQKVAAVEINDFQAALREFANPHPPKPDEPTGLGAVVEDADGTKWLRHDSVAIHRRWLNTDDCDTRFRAWDEINAVRVLSEGWVQS